MIRLSIIEVKIQRIKTTYIYHENLVITVGRLCHKNSRFSSYSTRSKTIK